MNNKKRWKIEYNVPDIPEELLEAGYNPLLSSVLALKGITTPREAHNFLSDSEEDILDPFGLKDMQEAVERICLAVSRKEKVAVYGDYDVDGITATCIVTDYLRTHGLEVTPYIPDRAEEGYGLNCEALDFFRSQGISLVITVDCGITAVKEAEYGKLIGMTVIITDHHECKSCEIPDTCAVINPKRTDDTYENKALAGVGVAFKLVSALAMILDGEDSFEQIFSSYCDLVAIGTVADVMPLTGENRIFVKFGIRKLRENPRPGIRAMLRETQTDASSLNAGSIGYFIAPRLNAAGRLGKAITAGYLLMSENEAEATVLAADLCALNRTRQNIENEIWNEASEILRKCHVDSPIVLASDSWHQGVIGIAASRLAEQYSLPTIMICLNGEVGKGSCRSYGGFNLFDALSACSDHLMSFGGHALAAGLNIKKDKIEDFRAALSEYYKNNRPDEVPEVVCDLLIHDPSVLTEENVRSLDLLEPYGNCNPRPVMCMTGVVIDRLIPIGKDKHSKLKIDAGDQSFDAIFFSHPAKDLGVSEKDIVDVAFTPQINEYMGRVTVQLLVQAIRPHDPSDLCMEILRSEAASCLRAAIPYCPERADFVKIWRRLDSSRAPIGRCTEEVLLSCPEGIEPETYCICLKTLLQAGLLSGGAGVFGSTAAKWTKKVSLEETELLSSLLRLRSQK